MSRTSPRPDAVIAPSLEPQTLALYRAQHRQLQFEVARYIEVLLGELTVMAQAAELGHLAHFIALTRQEAGDQMQRCGRDR